MQPDAVLCKPGSMGFPQVRLHVAQIKIPVENPMFSTFSTGFSTGVFHSSGKAGEDCGDWHKNIRQDSTELPLFCGLCFLPQGILCAKISTWQGEVCSGFQNEELGVRSQEWTGIGFCMVHTFHSSFLFPNPPVQICAENFWKRGLILLSKCVTMFIRMEN